MNVAVMIILAIFGAAFGSFACCQAWRIRKNDKSPRSHCMSCKYKLKWYDNIPIFSWLFLRGRCRECHKKIGVAEILSELGLAAVFALSFWLWPYTLDPTTTAGGFEIAKFAVFLVQLVLFVILFVYDAKWKELPVKILLISAVVGAVFWGINFAKDIIVAGFDWKILYNLAGAMLILPGFYYFMYKASKEKWVGSGDAILCVPLALMLGNFWLAMFCLFLSNMVGSLIMLPVVAAKREKHAMIPFGPFLIVGFLLVFYFQEFFMNFVNGL